MARKNKIVDLRDHLFETLEMLKDGDIEIERAKAISEVSRTIIETAKVEIAFLREVGGTGSDFIPVEPARDAQKLLH